MLRQKNISEKGFFQDTFKEKVNFQGQTDKVSIEQTDLEGSGLDRTKKEVEMFL